MWLHTQARGRSTLSSQENKNLGRKNIEESYNHKRKSVRFSPAEKQKSTAKEALSNKVIYSSIMWNLHLRAPSCILDLSKTHL